ncbi:tyrosine-type recombinase/integrase [Clostridium sp.]|uniref:tyrosine-type recombinase/integrase n=1 Tax=Clostridium sp. TaxID=1506 RepID=UPI003D6C9982
MRKKHFNFHSVFSPEIRSFLELRAAQGHVIRHEAYTLETLDIFLVEHGLCERSLPAKTIDSWLYSFPNKLNANTLVTYVSYYTQFAKYMRILDIPAFIPERPKGNNDYVPYIFSEEEMKRLFAVCDNLPRKKRVTKTPVIFPVLLRMLYACGLRLDEALTLRLKDVDLKNGVLHVLNAKGSKDRIVPMDCSLTDICRNYCKLLHSNSEDTAYFFESHNHKRFSQAWAGRWFGIVLESAGIALSDGTKVSRGICPHCLRHTFAVDSFRRMERKGRDLYESAPFLSTYMGHYDLYGTEKYLRMTSEMHAEVVDQMAAYTSCVFPEVSE